MNDLVASNGQVNRLDLVFSNATQVQKCCMSMSGCDCSGDVRHLVNNHESLFTVCDESVWFHQSQS